MIPDVYDLWVAHDTQQQNELAKRPVCADCGEPIQQEDSFVFDGFRYCDECADARREPIEWW